MMGFRGDAQHTRADQLVKAALTHVGLQPKSSWLRERGEPPSGGRALEKPRVKIESSSIAGFETIAAPLVTGVRARCHGKRRWVADSIALQRRSSSCS